MDLTAPQRDRAAGVLLAAAAGDALGAPYEFGPPLPATTPVSMTGGGASGWQVGEWTDDTSMAIVLAQAGLTGDLAAEAVLDDVVARWVEWSRSAPDVGIQTRAVLGAAGPTAAGATAAARAFQVRTGRSGGNGSLMRTAPVALAYLDDPDGLITAANRVSALTHADPEAGEACVLWCLAIRHAVLTGELDVRAGLPSLASDRAVVWAGRIDVAETSSPADFGRNGWVVEALQAAWCAIATTPAARFCPPPHLQRALEAAVRGGGDTDTVAAIAGGLLGGAWGASAVPSDWSRVLHGWPGLRAPDLVQLGLRLVTGETEPDVVL